MDSWRRPRSHNYNQEVSRTRSQHTKPPLGNWQPTAVPLWEKKFCTVVGAVPWRKLLDAKKFLHLYDNVLKWDDSAGEEAFINAKNRFWAQINGLPCQIPSPDPDIYVDKIDWNSKVDPQLMLDLEAEPIAPDNQEKGEQVVILGELFASKDFYSTGWGDAEDDMKKPGLTSEKNGNPWEDDCAQAKDPVKQNGWGDVPSDSWCENQGTEIAKNSSWEDGWNQWENKNYESDNMQYGKNSGVWEPRYGYHKNKANTGGYVSRYKTSRFHGDDNPTNRDWRNGKGRKMVNFACERPYSDNKNCSKMNSCAPIRHHRSGNRGNQWSWEKPVSLNAK